MKTLSTSVKKTWIDWPSSVLKKNPGPYSTRTDYPESNQFDGRHGRIWLCSRCCSLLVQCSCCDVGVV